MNALLSTRVFRFHLVRSEDCCFAMVQKSQFWTCFYFLFFFSSATRTRTTAHSLANLLSLVMAPTDSKFCSIISDLLLMTSVGATLPQRNWETTWFSFFSTRLNLCFRCNYDRPDAHFTIHLQTVLYSKRLLLARFRRWNLDHSTRCFVQLF